jgi:hypothetical protein
MNIHPVSQIVPHEHTDGQTDTTKLIIAFRNTANAPKTGTWAGRQRAMILPL